MLKATPQERTKRLIRYEQDVEDYPAGCRLLGSGHPWRIRRSDRSGADLHAIELLSYAGGYPYGGRLLKLKL